jgi:capsular polysaccharide transport system ATP-binding protein
MIVFDGAGKAYRNRKGEIGWVFRDVTTTFADGQSTGILVPPGQGKTTFINVAAGNESLSEGRVFRHGKISWPFGARSGMSQRLSGRQNLRFLTDVYGRDFREAYDFVREFSDLGRYLDSPLRLYSGEMRARLAISCLFSMNFNYILIDGAMEGGDMAFRRKYMRYIEANRSNLTFLIATDKPQLVARYCESVGVLNEGKLTFYDSLEEATDVFSHAYDAVA